MFSEQRNNDNQFYFAFLWLLLKCDFVSLAYCTFALILCDCCLNPVIFSGPFSKAVIIFPLLIAIFPKLSFVFELDL